MTKLYRVLGKRGRITIPYEIRQRVGFSYNHVMSFTESPDGSTVTVKREKICDNCAATKTADKEAEMTLEDFLYSLSAEQQRVALVHLSVKCAEQKTQNSNIYSGGITMATKKPSYTKAAAQKTPLTAKIDRMIDRENATVKAYASVNIGGAFVIKDIAVVDGQKGMFARMPFRSYKTGSGETKYSDIAFALTDEARQSLNDAVLGAYREALEESEDELPDEDESLAQSM